LLEKQPGFTVEIEYRKAKLVHVFLAKRSASELNPDDLATVSGASVRKRSNRKRASKGERRAGQHGCAQAHGCALRSGKRRAGLVNKEGGG
jgi:hypothetical protein